MSDKMKVTAIVGSYRKGGIIDSAIDEILDAAGAAGADTKKIHLTDTDIAFCTNCRACTQLPGKARGECVLTDEMRAVLDDIDGSDAVVLGSPMNFGTVTAIMKRFIERLVCFGYWPWGMNAPKIRNPVKDKTAVVVASSAAPAVIGRLMSRMVKLQKDAAALLGARTIGVLFIGLAAGKPHQAIGEGTRKKARLLGTKLVTGHRR